MPVIRYQLLRQAGATRTDIERMLADGTIVRVRPGWYASRDTDVDVIAAVRAGGSVSCGAALRRHGIWTVLDQVHLRVAPHARLWPTSRKVHRMPGSAENGVDDVATALRTAMGCLPRELAVCAIDSVLNSGAMTRSRVVSALDTGRGRELLMLADGRSQSGIETLARLRLRGIGLRVSVQRRIAGVGWVDLVVGDRLVIELDGQEWHSSREQWEKDRRRDSALVALGYVVMRASYDRVMNDWAEFEREVLAVVRRREHLWRRVHGVGRNEG